MTSISLPSRTRGREGAAALVEASLVPLDCGAASLGLLLAMVPPAWSVPMLDGLNHDCHGLNLLRKLLDAIGFRSDLLDGARVGLRRMVVDRQVS